MNSTHKKTYSTPNVGAFSTIAAVPAVAVAAAPFAVSSAAAAAPLAVTSVSSALAFVGGLAGGAALASWAMSGKYMNQKQSESLLPTDSNHV